MVTTIITAMAAYSNERVAAIAIVISFLFPSVQLTITRVVPGNGG